MNKKAALSVILAGALWGIIAVFINNLSAAGLDAMNISFVRMSVSASVFLLFVLLTDRSKLKIKLKDIWIFACTGIVSVVMFNCCYFYTLIHSQASVAVVLLYTSPAFILLLSAVFFKEKITPIKVSALILTLCGCVFTAELIGSGAGITPFIMLTGIGSGLFYGLYTIFGRIALKKYDKVTVTVYTFVFGFIGSIFVGKPVETVTKISDKPQMLIWCIGVGVICTVLPYFLYTSGLQSLENSKAAILVAVEPLVGAIIGMTVYHESRGLQKIIGIICISCGIILLNLPDKKAEKSASL